MSYQSSPPNKSNTGIWLGGAAILLVALIAVLVLLLNRQPAPAAPASAVIVSAASPTAEPAATPTTADTARPAPTDTSTPTSTPMPELGTSNLFIEYILDASGSMSETLSDGSPKIEVAQRVLTDHMRSFRPETNIGLRVYGHRLPYQQTDESCQDIELIAPPEKGQMERIVSWLQDFTVQGMTPLAASLELAKDDFVYDASRINSIVMLSDGIETCGGDPCRLVEELKAEGINFTIHVIGLDVDDPARQQLTCIAEAGDGTYHDARSQEDLNAALGAVQADVTRDEVIVPPGVNTATPATPTETPFLPTDTPLPPTNTPVPPTATPVTLATPITATPFPTPTEVPEPSVGDNEVLFRGRGAIGGGFSTECYSSPCSGEGDMNNAPSVFCRIAVTEVVSGEITPGSQLFVQVRRDSICSGQNHWLGSCPPVGAPVTVLGHWTQWPSPVQLPPDVVGIVEICTDSAYFIRE